MSEDIFIRRLNKFQTPLSKELKDSMPKESWNELLEYIDSVRFIDWLISPEEVRGFAKDREKDADGKIIIDLTKPHILENMDFFRERALYFEKYGKYTDIRPNPNPKSDYALFWKEEVRRWKDGLVRESDGEWIPGWYYFYLNYSPIWLNVEAKQSTTSRKTRAQRIRAFPKPWLGDYLFFHYMNMARDNGHHCKLLKTRGVGFSYKTGAISPCNMYTEVGLPNFHLASDKTFLEGDKGVFGKVIDVLDWIADNTPLPRMRLIDRALEKQLGFTDEYGIKKGLKSSVFGISLKDNPDKARGVRGPLIHYEEDGLFPNLDKAWGVNRKAVEDGDNVFGMMMSGGTGGTEGSNFEGSEKLFYSPGAYNIQEIENAFDKNTVEGVKCGFFWGAYLNRAKCYDPDIGEPDVIKALVEVLIDRHQVKYSASDPQALTQKKAEEPITPQEAVMRTTGTIFPVADLKDCKESIVVQGDAFFNSHYIGNLVYGSDGEAKWEPDSSKYPIRKFPHKDNKLEGALEIFEMPKKVGDRVVRGRYIAGIDPVDDDSSTTVSLPSIFVLDLFTDRIVAEYTGRPKFADDFYEICIRLLEFYGAEALYENDKKGLFRHFDHRRKLHLLAGTPQHLRDMDMVKGALYGNKALGVNSGKMINGYARRLLKEWMLTEAHTQEYDENGDKKGTKLNLHTIRSVALLEECIQWNQDGNFDRVSAMGMCMILRAEKQKFLDQIKDNGGSSRKKLAKDPYFVQNCPFLKNDRF